MYCLLLLAPSTESFILEQKEVIHVICTLSVVEIPCSVAAENIAGRWIVTFVVVQLNLSKEFNFCHCLSEKKHWRIQGRPRPTVPMGPNSFVFAYVFGKKRQRWTSAPPNKVGALPQMGNPGFASAKI